MSFTLVVALARDGLAQRRPRRSERSSAAAGKPRLPVVRLRDELSGCPDVADAMDWPAIEARGGDTRRGSLWTTSADSLEEMRTAHLATGTCSLVIAKFGEAEVDLAVSIETETYGSVTAEQLRSVILAHGDRALAATSEQGRADAPEFSLSRALTSMTHEVHDTHLTPHYGFFDPVVRAQPWFRGEPAAARATVWSRDARLRIGASDPPAYAYVAATEAVSDLGQTGTLLLRTSRFTFPYEGLAVAVYDSHAGRHRWVGVFPGAVRMRLGPSFVPALRDEHDEALPQVVLLDVTENVEGAVLRAVYAVDLAHGLTYRIAGAGPITLERAGIRIRVPRQRAVSISAREIASRLATSVDSHAAE